MKPSRSLLRLLTLPVLLAVAQVPGVSAQDAVGSQERAPMATVRAVRYHVEPGQTRVWFETTGAVLYTHYSPDPLTLVIDLPGVDISTLAERTVVGSSEVESVLATSLDGMNGKKLSRLEIKLAAIAPYQITGSEQALNVTFDGGDVPEAASSASSEVPQAANAASSEVAKKANAAPSETPKAASDASSKPAPERGDSVQPPVVEEDVVAVEKVDIVTAAAPSPPPTPSVPAHPASTISDISHELVGDVLRVHLAADGRLNYTSFKLDGPPRLVFDFNGVLNEVRRAGLSIDQLGVARARVAQFRAADPRITRVVFDLNENVQHRTSEAAGGLEIAFARTEAELYTPTTLASIDEEHVEVEQASSSDAPTTFTDSDLTAVTIRSDGQVLEPYSIQGASYSPEDGGSFETITLTNEDLALLNPGPEAMPTLPTPPPQDPGAPPRAGVTPDPNLGTLGQREYTGELISLDFKDGDIQDIFRLFADISGLNIVVQPGVSGRITLKLTEVPWDQALELILKTNKLGYIVEGNVIRIAPLSELAAEEAERRRLAEEKALAGDLFTQTRVLSYAKASEIQPLLQRNLSARGDIVIDERTNTVIFTDLAEQITSITALIDSLDTAIPGVEIEARIVVTTRTFSRSLGVQWGFTSNQLQTLGNTTELTFPNSIQLGGAAIGSTAAREYNVPGASSGGLLPGTINEGSLQVQRGYAVNLPFAGAPTGAVGLSLGSITGSFSIDAALSAAEARGNLRIISAPKIITQNNRAAEIKQGITFPVQVVANNTITVQFKDAVLELSVTPQITSAETIILDMEVNNDSLDFGRSVNGIPSIITQAATTQVLVPDGSTTVIGGVFVNTRQTNEQFVPLLHRIPILGHLFKTKNNTTENQELLIFLTPRIRKDTV